MAETHNGDIAACIRRCDALRSGDERRLNTLEMMVSEMSAQLTVIENEKRERVARLDAASTQELAQLNRRTAITTAVITAVASVLGSASAAVILTYILNR